MSLYFYFIFKTAYSAIFISISISYLLYSFYITQLINKISTLIYLLDFQNSTVTQIDEKFPVFNVRIAEVTFRLHLYYIRTLD